MDAIEGAAELIRKRLGEIERERDSLETALSSLTRGNGSVRSPRRATRRRAGARTQKRAARGKRQDQFLAAVRERPDAKMAEIAKQVGVRPQQLYPIARRLTASGTITKGADGYVISDGGGSPRKKPRRSATQRRAARRKAR